ncbi:hypothetical protein ACFL6C_03420 [Myxococcota bacterium]
MFVHRIASGLLLGALVVSPAFAQGPRRPAPGFAPQPPKLTTGDVERLIKVIPELAKESGNLRSDPSKAMSPGAMGQQLPVEDLQRIEKLLQKHGYAFPEFLAQLTALVSTYLALDPGAFEKQLPTEDTPEIRKVLDDPKVSEEQKGKLRQEIAQTHANKELIRKQITALATEENKRVVRPLLAKVKRALETAEREAKKAHKSAAKKKAP